MGWTGDNGDPDNFLATLLSCESAKNGSNYSRWCNKTFDKYVDDAAASPDQNRRTQLYQQAQLVFKADAPWVTIAHAKVFRALDKKVTGFKMSPFGTDNFYGVDVTK